MVTEMVEVTFVIIVEIFRMIINLMLTVMFLGMCAITVLSFRIARWISTRMAMGMLAIRTMTAMV
ncbi:hypothetical protein SCE1572_52085 [Sorangium cellulosum So0157-2]|uniref:Uncharacterized protein n=1 Tax=Sorangium cellulosum So0157-2 TaxID=1254432 RepID=S4YD05_SORCE|nr:hypothetical protein SCE1572_52085 [Sorangium cellulosum So0157-2]